MQNPFPTLCKPLETCSFNNTDLYAQLVSAEDDAVHVGGARVGLQAVAERHVGVARGRVQLHALDLEEEVDS